MKEFQNIVFKSPDCISESADSRLAYSAVAATAKAGRGNDGGKMTKKIFQPAILFFSTFLLPALAFAQAKLSVSGSLPGVSAGATNPGSWINGFYTLALMFGGALAFGAVVYGGVLYAASAGNPSQQTEGKQWIWSALTGLLLLAGAWLVLKTINPDLTNISFPTLSSLSATAGTSGGGGGRTADSVAGGTGTPAGAITPGQGLNTAQATALLTSQGITIKPGASVNGMLLATVQDIESLEVQCKQAEGACNITITAGTDSHAAGTSHALGYKADLRSGDSGLDSYITGLPKAGIRSDGAQLYTFGNGTIADERNLPGVTPHWDLSAH